MRTNFYFNATVILLLLSSCNRDNNIQISSEGLSQRQAGNMSISFLTTNQQSTDLYTTKIVVNYMSDNTIQIRINADLDNEQIYCATSFSVSEPDCAMKVVNNPGSSQVVYLNKYSLVGSVNEQESISTTILSNSINTNSNTIIIEEADSF
jgi:predicted transcriptional regulator